MEDQGYAQVSVHDMALLHESLQWQDLQNIHVEVQCANLLLAVCVSKMSTTLEMYVGTTRHVDEYDAPYYSYTESDNKLQHTILSVENTCDGSS